MPEQTIAILDFGSQYAQLIARRTREQHVYCEIVPCTTSAAELRRMAPRGIVLSGGPASVYDESAPKFDPEILELGIPVLGICYGMQLSCRMLGGKVTAAQAREYGRAEIEADTSSPLFEGLDEEMIVWMSHGDQVSDLSDNFDVIARTNTCPHAAVKHRSSDFYGVQFHPEVAHTPRGAEMLGNFIGAVCGCTGDWRMTTYAEHAIESIRETAGDSKALCAVSGGVDSAVVAALAHHALGDRVYCVFVDNGLLRLNEADQVRETFARHLDIELHFIDAGDQFLAALDGITEPEAKRKAIGHEFIRVFEKFAGEHQDIDYLLQGTLYPDVIESISPTGGPSATIKSHHNVGGLPDWLNMKIIEPLRYLFKDEVRELGRQVNVPEEIVGRHPFPGPGLAVRVVGDVTQERLDMLCAADAIFIEELRKSGWYSRTSQAFAVLLPISSVGVMGDERTYENVVALRSVDTVDYMTADWSPLPHELLASASSRIINEVRGVNRVVYDISSKPPSTVEWE